MQTRQSHSLLRVDRSLELLLRSELVGMSTLLLPAVGRSRRKTSLTIISLPKKAFLQIASYITLAANHLIAVILASQSLEGWFNNATAQTKNKMQSRFL